mmetsp:Transcript_9111/g.16851  ORF Transcript_9111/g.16851 Transcript_9111/m.16851 type:complete len:97 (+) Transcript_9111:598-888(+)
MKARMPSMKALDEVFLGTTTPPSKARKKSARFDVACRAPTESDDKKITCFVLPIVWVLLFKMPSHNFIISMDISLSMLVRDDMDDFARTSKTLQIM